MTNSCTSGHGIHDHGRNFMLPASFESPDIRNHLDVLDEAIPIEKIQRRMQEANTLNIVLLDGCRTPSSLLWPDLTVSGMRMASQHSAGSIIALAGADSRADAKSQDQRQSLAPPPASGQRNSVFASSLLKHLRKFESIKYTALARL